MFYREVPFGVMMPVEDRLKMKAIFEKEAATLKKQREEAIKIIDDSSEIKAMLKQLDKSAGKMKIEKDFNKLNPNFQKDGEHKVYLNFTTTNLVQS